jgi:predicted nucleic acid-binding protein
MVLPKPEMPPALVLVDSSYYITLLRQGEDPLAELKRYEHSYDIAVNGVICAEVLRGRADPHVRDRYQRAFGVARFLSLTPRSWQRVAQIAWELDRRGDVIPLPDIIIGVTAIEHGAAVLTFDRHYQKIPGVVAISDLE